jgi:iron complex outermembrane receptor protein
MTHPLRRLGRTLAWGAALALPCAAASQTPDSLRGPDFDSVFVLEGVRVPVPPRLTQTGGASTVQIRLDSMSVIPAPTLEDVLRRIPLIQIRRNSRGEAQPAMRGAEDRQIAVLVDGVPLTLSWDHRTDFSVIPLTAARSVNLHRGVSSVLYGPNVLGGVVEVDVVRGAQRMIAPAPMSLALGVDQTGATNVTASAGRLLEPGEGQFLVRGGIGFRNASGVTLPGASPTDADERARLVDPEDGDLRLNSDFREFDAFVAGRYQSGSGAWASLTASGFEAERGVPPETHEAEPRLWRYPDQDRFVAALSGGTGQRRTALGFGDLEASVGVDLGSFTISSFESLAYETVEGVEQGEDETITLRLLGDHTLGEQGDLRAAFTYGDVSHLERLIPGGQNEYRQRLWSAGVETEWRVGGLLGVDWLDATRVSLGGVVDGADTPKSGDKPALDQLWDWGARLGVSSVTAGGSVLMHGGLSRRVRFPSLRELYSGALGRFLPNPDLRPETQWAGELGVTWNGSPVEFQVVGFRQELDNGIVRISVDTPEDNLRQRVNRDRITSTGVELVASGRLGPVAFAGDATLQSVRQFDDAGVRSEPEYEPNFLGKLDLSFPLVGGAQGSFDVRYQGSQKCLNVDTGGFDELEPNRSFDFELRRVFRAAGLAQFDQLDAVVGIANLTDAAVLDQCGLPQPGRTLRFQISLF